MASRSVYPSRRTRGGLRRATSALSWRSTGHPGVAMVVAIHSTVLGPALGGTRMSLYAESADPGASAYADALRLSRAMTYKNALAGLAHGGGKGVIIADPAAKSREVLHAYGRLVDSLDGRYVTAGDVGHDGGRHGRHRRGVPVDDRPIAGERRGGRLGRSSPPWACSRGCVRARQFVWGTPDLAGRRVGVVGAGKVGGRLVGRLVEAGAESSWWTRRPTARAALLEALPDGAIRRDRRRPARRRPRRRSRPTRWADSSRPSVAERITARLVCGGANNQLAEPAVGDLLAARGDRLRAGLPGQLRWRHPGGRGARRLRPRAGPGADRAGVRDHPAGARARGRSRA